MPAAQVDDPEEEEQERDEHQGHLGHALARLALRRALRRQSALDVRLMA